MNDESEFRLGVEEETEDIGEFMAALSLYRNTFGDYFPTIPLLGLNSEEEIIEMINKCVAENKDVCAMGYFDPKYLTDPGFKY
ncbi:MAG: hypothetical protein ACK5KQ_01460 [Anaerorhabdus sp.]